MTQSDRTKELAWRVKWAAEKRLQELERNRRLIRLFIVASVALTVGILIGAGL